MQGALFSRMSRELKLLQTEPPPGVWAGPKGDSLTELEAQVQGPADTVYEGGVFKLEVNVPARYPFEPPKVRFLTQVHHPNIDGEGRICLDILNMPPKGAWKPSLNLSTVLASIGLLLAHPNPDDGLVADITQEFKHQRQVFDAKARQYTQRYAMQSGSDENSKPQARQQEGQAADQQADGGAAGESESCDSLGGAPPPPQQQQQEQPGTVAGSQTLQGSVDEQRAGDRQAGENSSGVANQATRGQAGVEVPAKRPRLALRK